MKEIEAITNELLRHLEKSRDRFLTNGKPEEDREFFMRVKKEADPVLDLLDEWEQGSLKLIENGNSTLHTQQIDSTKENMRTLLLHSYYRDVRKRRFMEMYKSCYYIYNQLIKELA